MEASLFKNTRGKRNKMCVSAYDEYLHSVVDEENEIWDIFVSAFGLKYKARLSDCYIEFLKEVI